MEIFLYLIAVLLYLSCAVLPARLVRVIAAGTVLAWLFHGLLLGNAVWHRDALALGFAAMLSAAVWISVAVYWLGNRNVALDSLRILMLPCAAVALVLPELFPGSVVPLAGKSPLFVWHVGVALLAYSTLTIAAFHSIVMVLQDARLHASGIAKASVFGAAIDRLPALLTMEKMLFRLITLGFVLLTLTVLSGVVFSEALFGAAVRWDHKTVFTLLSWLLFGTLLAGRHWRGWRGKTALTLTLVGFAALLLAYVGSRFVLEVILHRGLT